MMQTLRKMNEGSLLQRTMLHIALFVLGSASVVALASVLLVSTAKALLPPHDATDTGADKAEQEQDEESGGDSSSPEAAAGAAGARTGTKALAQMRLANRRESAVAR
ncbi:hypothetical protein BE17_38520 [Sorangium cellulosum]|uniref:Uncharacterized protein n=1 Tax=Sorangium cellulosum TaxID=56 RepID=A0A150SV10_SORCE|nr:hypothetical protein BE17_38520 [Sorangium cellulosum]